MNMRRTAAALIITNLLLIVIVLDGTISAAGSRGQILRGNGLELTGIGGTTRVRITMEPSGEVVLRLCDQDGTIRVKLGASKDGSGLVLMNDSTEVGLQLLAKGTGSSIRLTTDGRQQLIAP